jgi:peptidoglycan glycosyltransferase
MDNHGEVDLKQALSDSCNCYFGKLAEELGPDIMNEYVDKTGLTKNRKIDGITTAAGSFEFPESGVNLAWAGIGQHKDLVNPCTMMMYMGAIANGGQAVKPRLIESVRFTTFDLPASLPAKSRDISMIDEGTANILKGMMAYNVEDNYGTYNFPDLKICAKSGTAEVGADQTPNAWFAGFLDDEEHPYAFIVLVENGGSGSSVAGSVANKVLQEVVEKY